MRKMEEKRRELLVGNELDIAFAEGSPLTT
jgi:hypothetical protein